MNEMKTGRFNSEGKQTKEGERGKEDKAYNV